MRKCGGGKCGEEVNEKDNRRSCLNKTLSSRIEIGGRPLRAFPGFHSTFHEREVILILNG